MFVMVEIGEGLELAATCIRDLGNVTTFNRGVHTLKTYICYLPNLDLMGTFSDTLNHLFWSFI